MQPARANKQHMKPFEPRYRHSKQQDAAHRKKKETSNKCTIQRVANRISTPGVAQTHKKEEAVGPDHKDIPSFFEHPQPSTRTTYHNSLQSMSSTTSRPLATPKPRLGSSSGGGGAKSSPLATTSTPKEQDLPYEEREIRNRAARMLENEEMLLLLSRQRHEVKQS